MTAEFKHVMLMVKDVMATVKFYSEGLGLPVKMASPGWAELDANGTTIALHAASESSVGNSPILSFHVDDVYIAISSLEALGASIQFYPGQRLVYVAALSVAPWNRHPIQNPPQFKTVGSALLSFSWLRRVELGYGGRVGLHALSGATGFYERKNMMRLDPDPDDRIDPDEELLTYFEYPVLNR